MTPTETLKFFELLEKLIDTKIEEHQQRDSSDGGISEAIRINEIREQIVEHITPTV